MYHLYKNDKFEVKNFALFADDITSIIIIATEFKPNYVYTSDNLDTTCLSSYLITVGLFLSLPFYILYCFNFYWCVHSNIFSSFRKIISERQKKDLSFYWNKVLPGNCAIVFVRCTMITPHCVVSVHYNDVMMGAMASQSNHQPHHSLLNRSFRRRSKEISKLRVTGPYAGNSSVTDDIPTQMASNAEMVPFDSVIMVRNNDISVVTLVVNLLITQM